MAQYSQQTYIDCWYGTFYKIDEKIRPAILFYTLRNEQGNFPPYMTEFAFSEIPKTKHNYYDLSPELFRILKKDANIRIVFNDVEYVVHVPLNEIIWLLPRIKSTFETFEQVEKADYYIVYDTDENHGK